MAQSGGSGRDIRQRITLDGGEAIKRELREMGKAGEDAVRQIEQATNRANTPVGRLQGLFGRLRSGITDAVEPARQRIDGLRESAAKFSEDLRSTTERVVPHFAEAIGIGTGAAVAGFFALQASAARSVATLTIASRELGVPIRNLQAYGAAAKVAGTESEAFFAGLLKLSRDIQQVAQDRRNTLLDQISTVTQGINVAGPIVVRGPGSNAAPATGQTAEVQGAGVDVLRGPGLSSIGATASSIRTSTQSAITVLRGGAQAVTAVANGVSEKFKGVATEIAQQQLKLFHDIADTVAKANGISIQQAQKLIPTLQQQTTRIQNLLLGSEEEREKSRNAGFNVPFLSMAEAAKHLVDTGQSVAKTLQLIGVRVLDITGKKRPLEDVLKDFSTWFDTTDNRGQAASIAFQLLGDNYNNLLKLFAQGTQETKQIITDFLRSGLGFEEWQSEQGKTLNRAINTLEVYTKGARDVIALAFAPATIPLIQGINKLIADNVLGLEKYVRELAGRVEPAVQDVLRILNGASSVQLATPFGRDLLASLQTAQAVGSGLIAVFQALLAPVQIVVFAINSLFGTNFSVGAIAAIGVLGQVTGAWKLLGAAAALTDAILSAFVTGPLVALVGAAGPIALVAVLTAVIAAFIDWKKAWDGLTAAANGFVGLIRAVVQLFADPLSGAVKAAIALLTGDFADAWKLATGAIRGTIDAVTKLIGAISEALGLKQQLSNTPSPAPTNDGQAGASGLPGGVIAGGPSLGGDTVSPFAGGGLAVGRGTSTSDSIWARVSNGEFVQRAAAVKHYGVNFMHRLNSMQIPRGFALGGLIDDFRSSITSFGMPAPRYATGGLVAFDKNPGLGPHTWAPLVLQLAGRDYGLFGPPSIVESLGVASRAAQVRSLGRAPTWEGGRFVD